MFEELLQWRQKQDMERLVHGSSIWPSMIAMLNDTRIALKDFFRAKESEVALVPNFSIGLNLLLEGQDTDQRVLLLENDYPSVNWPFDNRNFQITYVKPDHQLEKHIEEEVKTGNVDILALSLVQWLDGVKIESDFLKKLKTEHPDLLVIADGTQYCGAFELDMDNSGIDVLGSSGYKWMLGGYGNGFMLIRNDAMHRFHNRSIGFNSADGNLNTKDQIAFCKRLEPGHLDSQSFGSLCQSLKLLNQIGMDKIDARNQQLSKYAISSFSALDLLEDTVLMRAHHGCIFRLAADKALFDQLKQNNVQCSWRSGAIRLSFHFYNTEHEIDRIVEIIKMTM